MTAAIMNTHVRDNLSWLHDSFVITGIVNGGTGAVGGGTGFSSSRTGVGRYTVTFSVAFAVTPIFVATAEATTGTETLTINSPAAGSVLVNVDSGGVPADRNFYFAAIALH